MQMVVQVVGDDTRIDVPLDAVKKVSTARVPPSAWEAWVFGG